MLIENFLNEKMIEVEFSTFWELGGDLEPRFVKTAFGQAVPINNVEFEKKFDNSLTENLENFYSQVGYINLTWDLNVPANDEYLINNEWISNNLLVDGVQVSSIKYELGGNMNIVPFREMMNPNEWLSSSKHPGSTFLPFDRHWELIICFKEENGIVEDNLYILNIQDMDVVIDMKVSLFQYFELAYKAKCFFQWQMAYVFHDGFDNEKLRVMLPLILPHVKLDLSNFGIEL